MLHGPHVACGTDVAPGLNRRFEYDFDFADDDVPVVVVVAVVVGESENNDFYCACEKGTLFPQKNMENKGKEGKWNTHYYSEHKTIGK